MTITYNKLKGNMSSITGLLFTMPESQIEKATEIWIKFKDAGRYVFIDFEQPLPSKIEFQKLVGAGNALNCSEFKKDLLIQYNEKKVVIKILNNSIGFRGNLDDTIKSVIQLFDDFEGIFLY